MYTAHFQTGSSCSPAALSSAVVPPVFPNGGALALLGETNTIAQVLLLPDDYVLGSTTEPEIEFALDGGSGGDFSATITPGGGTPAETIAYQVRQHTAGSGDDFSKVRGLHLRVFPLDPDAASSCKILAVLGDPAAGAWERIVLPLGYDSASAVLTGAGGSPASEALLILPLGHTYGTGNPLVFTIYQAANVQLVASFLGK